MKIKPIPLAIGVSLASLAAVAQAETSTSNNLETVTVVSSRTEVPLKELATSVQIITEADIELLGQLSLADILRSATSIAVSNTGGLGKTTTLRIRGEEGFRTKLLLDGVELSDPSSPQVAPAFDDLLSSQVSQIEILRGAQGLMYGADAGGVISVSSHIPTDGLAGSISGQWGKYGNQQLNGDLSFGNERGGLFIAATDLSTDGFNAQASDSTGEVDGYDNTTLHLNGHFNINDALSVKLVLRDVDGTNEYDGCFDSATFTSSNQCVSESSNRTARLSASYDTEQQSHEIGVAKTEVERNYFTAGQFGFGNEGEIEKADYVGAIENDTLRVVFGADIEKQNLANEQSRYQRGAFAQVQTEFNDNVFLNAGLRYDDNETFGTHTSYRLGAAYLLPLDDAGTIKLKTTYGTGFRAPSLFEQDYNDGPFAWGDAAGLQLKEETSKGIDLGVEYYAPAGAFVEVVLFEQSIDDEIMFDTAAFQGYLQSEGTSKSKGVETSFEVPVSRKLVVWGNYTYNDTETNEGDNRLRRPRHLASLGVAADFAEDKLKVSAYLNSVKDAVDIGGVALDDYTIANLTLRYNWSSNLAFHIRAENLFDKEYEEVSGFNTAGRSVFAGFKASL